MSDSAENDAPMWCSEHMEPYCPRHQCRACRGRGRRLHGWAICPRECEDCGGVGYIIPPERCDWCSGTGYVGPDMCNQCDGTGDRPVPPEETKP